jgi:hypothetical protein
MLRDKLQELTMTQDVSQHPELLTKLSCICENTIELLASEHPIGSYTCLMHVLEFTEKPEYVEKASSPVAYAGAKFAQWLLDKSKLREIPQVDAKESDIIFYFNGREFKHTGILRNCNRVISKWGTGHLYEHDVFEVPSSYGESVRFFSPLGYDDAYNCFSEFAAEPTID